MTTRNSSSHQPLFVVAFLAVVMTVAAPAPASSQSTDSAPPLTPTLRTFLPDLVGDIKRLPSIPAGISVVSGGIVSASVSPFDDNLSDWDPNNAYKSGQWIGNPFVLGGATLLAYGIGEWGDKPRVRHVADDALRAQVLALGITYALKYTVQRERPDQSSNDSFPSGHASQTFATATVLARHLGVKWAVPAYGTAAFVSISRVNQHRHWISDVAFGAGLGVAVGWNGNRHPSNWALEPSVSHHEVALRISHVLGR
jgi:membrane-associated phospholipid phosphatase